MNEERRQKDVLSFTIKVWRQKGSSDKGQMVSYPIERIRPEMSFLEMLDILNNELQRQGEEPIAFDSDCREGICGSCAMNIDGAQPAAGIARSGRARTWAVPAPPQRLSRARASPRRHERACLLNAHR